MILSVSRRTDIPAFYSEWFYQRIQEGFVCVRNPMNAHQVSRINISPEVVDCIVFWTKNAAPMMNRLDALKEYDYYFQFTINDYGKEAEPHVPELSGRLETFIRFSEKIGRERVIWRYDPILFSDKYTPEIHLKSFEKIASALGKYTEKCVFSFVDDRQREHCRCVKCDDIGSYDTCPHGCIYCYANFRPNIVADRIRAYDVHSPLLCDGIKETDKITERPVKSYKRRYEQLTLFD